MIVQIVYLVSLNNFSFVYLIKSRSVPCLCPEGGTTWTKLKAKKKINNNFHSDDTHQSAGALLNPSSSLWLSVYLFWGPSDGKNPFKMFNQLLSNLPDHRVHSAFGPRSPQALVPVPAVPLLLQPRHAGASHRDGDVDLGVGVAAADAGARPPQDDGRRVDGSAAVLVALHPVRSDQTALTQAVGLRDVAGIPGRVVREPARGKEQ